MISLPGLKNSPEGHAHQSLKPNAASALKAYAPFFASLVLLICLSNEANAFGMSLPYFPENTIKLEPGQSFVFEMGIQNNEDTGFNIDLAYAIRDNIAVLRDRDNFIPPKSYSNKFIFDIKVPEDSMPGDTYTLSLTAKPVLNNTGMVPMSVQISRSITIMVVDEFGQGYRETAWDKVKNKLESFSPFAAAGYKPILILLSAAAIFVLAARFWKASAKISGKLQSVLGRNRQKMHGRKILPGSGDIEAIKSQLHKWKTYLESVKAYKKKHPGHKIHGKSPVYWIKTSEANIHELEEKIREAQKHAEK